MDDLSTLWNFLMTWAYPPASAIILALVAVSKKTGILDLGKLRFLSAIVLGIGFAVGQKFIAAPLGYSPIHTEWIPVIFMGLCTGLAATLAHTTGKNFGQWIKGGE